MSAQPIAFRSDTGGADDFANPCGPLVTDPTIEANIPQDVTGGTLVARPVVDKNGNLYVLFATTTQQENAAAAAGQQPSGTFSQLYMAVSKDHCQSFTNYTVYDGSQGGTKTNTVQFGDIFNDLAIDGGGQPVCGRRRVRQHAEQHRHHLVPEVDRRRAALDQAGAA